MAIAVAYGLLMATYTTLIMLPGYLVVLNNIRRGWAWAWLGGKHSREEVEPAVIELEVEREYIEETGPGHDSSNNS